MRAHCDLIAFNNINNDYENVVVPKKGVLYILIVIYVRNVCLLNSSTTFVANAFTFKPN